MDYRGAQLHQQFKRSGEFVVGPTAPLGVATVIPYTLLDQPQSARALKVFFGSFAFVPNADPNQKPTFAGSTTARLACLGVEFSVNLATRQITWLPTARWPLGPNNYLEFEYYTFGRTA